MKIDSGKSLSEFNTQLESKLEIILCKYGHSTGSFCHMFVLSVFCTVCLGRLSFPGK